MARHVILYSIAYIDVPTKESNKRTPVIYISVHLVSIYTLTFSNVLLVLALNLTVHKSSYCKCSLAWCQARTFLLFTISTHPLQMREYGGKSPVGAYKRVEALQFFSCFQNIFYRIIKKGWNVDLVDISSDWKFIWQQLTTILLVYHLSILRYFQFNEVSQGWRRLRIRMPRIRYRVKLYGFLIYTALHTHMLTNAKSVVTFEIGIIPW